MVSPAPAIPPDVTQRAGVCIRRSDGPNVMGDRTTCGQPDDLFRNSYSAYPFSLSLSLNYRKVVRVVLSLEFSILKPYEGRAPRSYWSYTVAP